MEKYGTDMSELAPTDDQLREIKKIASTNGTDVPTVRSQEEARQILDEMRK